jgi:hypothetical protein
MITYELTSLKCMFGVLQDSYGKFFGQERLSPIVFNLCDVYIRSGTYYGLKISPQVLKTKKRF